SETQPLRTLSLVELAGRVRRVATRLREMGVQPGDRVVAYLPNVPECAIAMLAATSIGAVWSSAAIDFGVRTVEALQIAHALPSLEALVWLSSDADALPDGAASLPCATHPWHALLDGPDVPPDAFRFERVGPDHPLWIVFSSGTTGLPKAIVHSHVGILVEHLKLM
ncbi:AMP-binding protein, partial [Burkholderia gladioli]|uniref:AMP-binding protein n=1 Tax=Burkholderia gladioli TaxID=28095 RepID=UPI00163EBB99